MEASSLNGCDGHVSKAWQRLFCEAVWGHKHQRQKRYPGCYAAFMWWARNQGEGDEVM